MAPSYRCEAEHAPALHPGRPWIAHAKREGQELGAGDPKRLTGPCQLTRQR